MDNTTTTPRGTRAHRMVPRLAQSQAELGLALDDVVIIFASDNHFAPYLSVAMQSLVENVSDERHYDIVVFTRDMSPESMLTLAGQTSRPNVGIGFLDVDAALGETRLPHYGHFRPETYFRLLAPSLLPGVEKAIYLDSDLVVLADVAELFDTDVTGSLLAATRDADTVGQIHGYDEGVGPYLSHDLGMSDPYSYFQAGVLLLNLAEFRRRTTPEQLLGIATLRTWRWLDQDVLNRVCDGDYVRVDMAWNFLYDWQHLRRSHIVASAPAEFVEEYGQASTAPKVIHYAGPDDRPWLYPNCDHADVFWHYASHSPYLGTLRYRLEESRRRPAQVVHRTRAGIVFKALLPAFDKVCPPNTLRRKNLIGAYMRLGGSI